MILSFEAFQSHISITFFTSTSFSVCIVVVRYVSVCVCVCVFVSGGSASPWQRGHVSFRWVLLWHEQCSAGRLLLHRISLSIHPHLSYNMHRDSVQGQSNHHTHTMFLPHFQAPTTSTVKSGIGTAMKSSVRSGKAKVKCQHDISICCHGNLKPMKQIYEH